MLGRNHLDNNDRASGTMPACHQRQERGRSLAICYQLLNAVLDQRNVQNARL